MVKNHKLNGHLVFHSKETYVVIKDNLNNSKTLEVVVTNINPFSNLVSFELHFNGELRRFYLEPGGIEKISGDLKIKVLQEKQNRVADGVLVRYTIPPDYYISQEQGYNSTIHY